MGNCWGVTTIEAEEAVASSLFQAIGYFLPTNRHLHLRQITPINIGLPPRSWIPSYAPELASKNWVGIDDVTPTRPILFAL